MILSGIIDTVRLAAWIAAIFFGIRYIVRSLRRDGFPAGLIAAEISCLLPVIAAPLVLFGSVFMFDNPSNTLRTFVCFLLVNSYSVFLAGGFLLSRRIYKKSGDKRRSMAAAAAGIALAAGVFVAGSAVAFV